MKQATIILFLFSILVFSCDDECICDNGPFYADMKVKVTINDDNPDVFLTVFDGKIESQDTLIAEWVNESTVFYEMEADRYYSAAVVYQDGNRQITAIDGRKMRTSEDDCGCDYAESMTLNLRLVNP